MDIDCMARIWVDPETGAHVSGARVCVDVATGGSTASTYCPHPDGGMVLVQRVSAADWATLAPLVAARAPLAPLVEHLDTAGVRDCLRDAAVDSEGD